MSHISTALVIVVSERVLVTPVGRVTRFLAEGRNAIVVLHGEAGRASNTDRFALILHKGVNSQRLAAREATFDWISAPLTSGRIRTFFDPNG